LSHTSTLGPTEFATIFITKGYPLFAPTIEILIGKVISLSFIVIKVTLIVTELFGSINPLS
jgi:hypothetical protein